MPMAANAGREEGAMPKSKPKMERKKTKDVKEKTTPGGLLIPGIVSSEIDGASLHKCDSHENIGQHEEA